MNFRSLKNTDWKRVSEIYQQGIATENATFQLETPSWSDWNRAHIASCRIVVEIDECIVGWAALSPVSNREVYRGVMEVSVYVANGFTGQKIGTQLLERLIVESEKQGIWTLQAGIFPENTLSLKLHKNLGFREIGYREKVGKMKGKWRNTILLERRSSHVGIN